MYFHKCQATYIASRRQKVEKHLLKIVTNAILLCGDSIGKLTAYRDHLSTRAHSNI